MVIRIVDIVPGADTGVQGATVYAIIKACLSESYNLVVSFEGITTATSSFVNAAFVEISEEIGFGEFKNRIKIVNSGKQINDMIKDRLIKEAGRAAA